MISPITKLPAPPPGKQGWPWFETQGLTEPQPLPANPLKISIATPSYNQAAFIEETIRSVLLQDYAPLEYIIIEDGSKDQSPEIIAKYQPFLGHYERGPNRGFGEAVNAGLQRCTGDIMAYLNSDDLYLPGALATVAKVFSDCPEVDWIVGASLLADRTGQSIGINSSLGFSKKLFYSGRYLGGHPAWNGKWIPQESVFWRRSLWEKAGGSFLRERLQYGDFELWSRFWQLADLHVVPVPLGIYRCHPATYTSVQGNNSLAPCTKLIADAPGEKHSPGVVRGRDLIGRLGQRFLQSWGEPAKAVEFDLASGKWKTAVHRVS